MSNYGVILIFQENVVGTHNSISKIQFPKKALRTTPPLKKKLLWQQNRLLHKRQPVLQFDRTAASLTPFPLKPEAVKHGVASQVTRFLVVITG
jgi:hypothetical protein